MSKFFVPYTGEQPTAVEIKGHRLLILGQRSSELAEGLKEIGGEEIREYEFFGDGELELAKLATQIKGGVVLAPPGTSVSAMLKDLERELPWVQ